MKITDFDDLIVIDQGGLINCALKTEDGFILFDSGLDESNCRKYIRELEGKIISIFHTHSHADHMGADAFLSKKFQPEIYINKREISFVVYPFLEPSLLYGGAAYSKITGKFLMAKSVEKVKSFEEASHFLNKYDISVIELFGHSPGHTGFLIKDNFFVGDLVFDESVIKKYRVLYLFDAKAHFESLNKVKSMSFSKMVYCHKGVLERDEALCLIDKNIMHIKEILELIYELSDNLTAEEITDDLIERLGVMKSMDIISLVNSTVKGYLRWLEEDDKVKVFYDKGVRWSK